VWEAIKELPSDRAPGPDGFIGAFYKKAWPIIKSDIMAALLKLYVGDGRTFDRLNRALITLIPKKQDAEEVGDYRPISLVHSFGKLFSKIMANRLRPRMDELVSKNQSAFIKRRNLHDNFMLVRQLARKINTRRESGVLLKLDISRAFDSLSWAFLFEVLRGMGFPEIFLRWVNIALRTASTSVLVNGNPGRRIVYARGLRQGDPLSPLLFVLSMEVSMLLFSRAAEHGLLTPIGNCSAEQRLSIYADDVVVFLKPTVQDLVTIRALLEVFGAVSGLKVNYSKTAATLIRGSDQDKQRVTEILQCAITEFPIRYLGLQLALRPLTKAQWQPMLDAAMKIVPAWQRGLIQRPGHLVLVKAVMAARYVHHLIITEAPSWLHDEFNKSLRGFFWAAKERANGGQCLVNWNQICKPLEFGGLGVKNTRIQSLALRVRWEWLRRTDTSRPWQGLPMIKDEKAREVFDRLVSIRVGDGKRTLFWRDRWIGGRSAAEIAPSLWIKVKTRCRNSRTVDKALNANLWVKDVGSNLTEGECLDCVRLWVAVHSLHRDVTMEDHFSWPWSKSGEYTAQSTYQALVQENNRFRLWKPIWRSRATPKSKQFMWLAVQNRIWTSERRFRHGLDEHELPCAVCLQEKDTADHLLLQCVVARETWHICRHRLDLNIEEPLHHDMLEEWWVKERSRIRGREKRDFDTLVCTLCYWLWKNRNAWVFQDVRRQRNPLSLAALVTEEYNLLKGLGERSRRVGAVAQEHDVRE
jgi:hypothetical protein